MEKSKEIKLLGVFASILLLVIIVTASFAYFGSFNVNLNNNVAVNVNAYSPGDAVFTSNATQLNLQVPAANMSQLLNGTLAAENTATLSISLTGAADLLTTCTYDIVYEYDDGSYIYGGTGTNHVSKNGDKEITLQVTNVNGTNNFASEKNFDYDSSWSNNKRTLVSGATIESDGTLTTQNIIIAGKYYNLTISQSSLEGKNFTGKIYVTNHSCEISTGMSVATLMSTSTPDIYNENGLRYEGVDSNNYICLDNKTDGICSDSSLLFRIIGLFDEDTSSDGTTSSGTKKLLKVIDTNNYGGTSGKYWDNVSLRSINSTLNIKYKTKLLVEVGPSDPTSTSGYNNWSTSSLKTELNGTYLTTLLGTSNVNSKLSSSIANAKWHLGGANDDNFNTLTAEGIYTEERNTSAIYSGNPSGIYAKVGLMYPSDYVYATVGGSTINKSSCRAKELYNWDESSYSDCINNDWLFTSQSNFVNGREWLLSPYSSNSIAATYLDSKGYLNLGYVVNNQYAVRPTFYLDSEIIKIVGGDGSSSNPYRIG